MLASFEANDVDMRFIFDDKAGKIFIKDSSYNNHDKLDKIAIVPEVELKNYLKKFKPDVIIHRYYKLDAVMHYGAYEIAKSLSIPYGIYYIESDFSDSMSTVDRFKNCDFMMYAHDISTIIDTIQTYDKEKQSKCYFYPYGVGELEYHIDDLQKKELITIGYYRSIHEGRVKNIKTYVNAIKDLNKKLNVYNPLHADLQNNWNTFKSNENLIINQQYNINEATNIINQYKIAINIESISDIENMYSFKILQTLGCGIPTITWRRNCIEKLFGFSGQHLIMVENENEIKLWIDFLLKNDKFREELGQRAISYVHKEFDWFSRFEKIMINEKIWHDVRSKEYVPKKMHATDIELIEKLSNELPKELSIEPLQERYKKNEYIPDGGIHF